MNAYIYIYIYLYSIRRSIVQMRPVYLCASTIMFSTPLKLKGVYEQLQLQRSLLHSLFWILFPLCCAWKHFLVYEYVGTAVATYLLWPILGMYLKIPWFDWAHLLCGPGWKAGCMAPSAFPFAIIVHKSRRWKYLSSASVSNTFPFVDVNHEEEWQ